MNDAEALAGAELWVPAAATRAAAGGDVLPARPGRLRGARHGRTRVVGRVTAVEGTMERSHLVVDGDRGEVMIPLVGDICVQVDPAARRIVVDPPEGLDRAVSP